MKLSMTKKEKYDMKPIVTTMDRALKKLTNKTMLKYPFMDFKRKWIYPFVPNKDDNWIECERDLWELIDLKIQHAIDKERERCAEIARNWKSDIYNPTAIDINAYIEESAKLIAKVVRGNQWLNTTKTTN